MKMKGFEPRLSFLNSHKIENTWFFSTENETSTCQTHHTRKELEEAGFGEVFNSPLFEVEEVEE